MGFEKFFSCVLEFLREGKGFGRELVDVFMRNNPFGVFKNLGPGILGKERTKLPLK